MILEDLTIVSIKEDSIFLENDKYKVELYHNQESGSQDNNYLYWNCEGKVTPEMRFSIDTDNYEALFNRIPGRGIEILPTPGTGYPIFIPGYSDIDEDNSGYYSNELLLGIAIVEKSTRNYIKCVQLDISECKLEYRY